jgi:transposase InsO family protein
VFNDIADAQTQLDVWVEHDNHDRPHQGIGMGCTVGTTTSLDVRATVRCGSIGIEFDRPLWPRLPVGLASAASG